MIWVYSISPMACGIAPAGVQKQSYVVTHLVQHGGPDKQIGHQVHSAQKWEVQHIFTSEQSFVQQPTIGHMALVVISRVSIEKIDLPFSWQIV